MNTMPRTLLAHAVLLALLSAGIALTAASAVAQTTPTSADEANAKSAKDAKEMSSQDMSSQDTSSKDPSSKRADSNNKGSNNMASKDSGSADKGSTDGNSSETGSSDKGSFKTNETSDASADFGTVDTTLRAQVLLERAHFSPGVIDGAMGGNTRRALHAYQSAHGLTATGEADDKTIKSLGGTDAPVLTRYSLTDKDVAGPFHDTPDGAEAMSKVDALPYASVEEKVAEQFHVTPDWLRGRNPDVKLAAGTTLTVPELDGASDLPKPARVIVDESDKSLLLEDESGKVVAHFPVTTGSAQFPLPIGDWKVTGVAADPVWHFNPKLIAGTSANAESADIPPGPNNPVGVVWIDLSKEHYGIHGTPDPERIGKTASNGCIRMTNWSATAVSKVVSTGMPVIMRH